MFYKIIRVILWPFVKIFYPYKIINKENITNEGNTIIICNHLQKADVYYTTFTFKGKSYYLSKKEWFKGKFLSKILMNLGAYPVDREKTDMKAIKNVLKLLKDGKRVIIFPEGTRNKVDLELLPIKDGPGYFAHKCNSTILPITIGKRAKMFRKNYVYVGKPFKLDNVDQKFSAEINEQITERVKQELLECRKQVNEYMENIKRKK